MITTEKIEKINISSVISWTESLWNQRSADPNPKSINSLEADVLGITKTLRGGIRNGFPEKFRSGTWPREDDGVDRVEIGCKTYPEAENTIPSTFIITVNWSKGGDRWSLKIIREIELSKMSKLRQVNITNQGQTATFTPAESSQG